jgi:hypothetical protein
LVLGVFALISSRFCNFCFPLVFISSDAILYPENRCITEMNCARPSRPIFVLAALPLPLLLLICLFLPAITRAQDADSARATTELASVAVPKTDTPYTTIIARNMFGLLPLPPPDTNPPAPPVDPPPKITPNGIMTIFGKDQALFKVAVKPKPGQPAKDVSYVLAEGEMQDEITVQKIDHVNGVITFDNHGTVQELPLVEAKDAAGGGGPGGGGGNSMGGFARGGPAGGPGDRANMFRQRPLGSGGMNSGGSSYNNNGVGNPSSSGGGVNPTGTGGITMMGGTPVNANRVYQPVDDPSTTPEENAILIEAQRNAYMQNNDPRAPLLPSTKYTKALNGDPNP